jgi:hypothetical protein
MVRKVAVTMTTIRRWFDQRLKIQYVEEPRQYPLFTIKLILNTLKRHWINELLFI